MKSSVAPAVRRTVARLVLCATALACAMPDAWAEGPRGWRGGRMGMPHGLMEGRGARQAERAQQRAARVPREAPQRVEQPVQSVQPPAPPIAPPEAVPAGRPGRLTLEERRALRQQINDAGRDVYRPNRP